ncbi:hypothetical protein [Psychromonas sp. SP041]|uniref:hypothetical protein n=1 Tax=Psychromonas sp. SP041 TaxID=1365007 RepID=UPI0010C79DD0|nr:hypothetical protein [Psychromonas sp. SP041]
MNWFNDVFLQMIDNKTWLYNLGFFSDGLLFMAIALCLVSVFSGKMTKKHYFLSFSIAVIMLILDKMVELPFYELFEHPRLKFLTMDTILYVLAMVVGLTSFILIATLKKLRTIESISFTSALLVMSVLIYSYHLLILNAGLKTAVKVNESFYAEIMSGDNHVFDFFCEGGKVTCYSGDINDFPKHLAELPNDFVLAYKELAAKPTPPVFMLSNVATTAETKYTSVFAQRGSEYRMIYDTKKAVRLFNSQKMQFMALANAAVLFWFIGSCLVVLIHRKILFKRK